MDLLTAFLNIEEFYRHTYWQAPTALTIRGEHATLSYSGIRWLNSANQLWFHVPFVRDDTQIQRAREFFREHGADYTINCTVPLMDGVPEWLSAIGFQERSSNPILSLNGAPRVVRNARVDVHPVGVGEQETLLQLLYELFYVGPEVARCIVQIDDLENRTPMRHYLAAIEGRPVGCGSVFVSAGVASIWSVGTTRPFRRRGVASTIIAVMLGDVAREAGITDSLLLASLMGRPLYEEMGFRWIGEALQFGPQLYR